MKQIPGTLVISLDFELFWGMTDKTTLEEYGANVRGVRKALPAMLELFTKYGIHATWAAVGMLTPSSKNALAASFPENKPKYENTRLSNYEYFKSADIGEDEAHDPHHFGASLLRRIQETPLQEVGSHTFSHYYCIEDGQTVQEFEADLVAQEKALAPFNITPVSLILPRNQWREDYLPSMRSHGFTSFRGNQRGFVYATRRDSEQSLFIRALRLIDHYLPLFGSHTYAVSDMRRSEYPHNIPASYFFRPFMPVLAFLEPLRLARMKASMTSAAKSGKLVHLWWHPHNFGIHTKRNLKNLEEVLMHFKKLQERYGMQSLSMQEVAATL